MRVTPYMCGQVCGSLGEASEVIPEECIPVLKSAGQPMPSTQHVKAFAMKHARQQAAILGHMKLAGLLQAETNLLGLQSSSRNALCTVPAHIYSAWTALRCLFLISVWTYSRVHLVERESVLSVLHALCRHVIGTSTLGRC